MTNYKCVNCGMSFSLPQEIDFPRCPSCGSPCQKQFTQGEQPSQGYTQQNQGGPQQNYTYSNPNQEPGIFDPGPSGKSRGVAGLLAILIGGLGVHYFYLEKILGGIFCIILTCCTCGIWSVITLIQGIIMLTMKQSDFEKKYVNTSSSFPLF